MKLLQIFRLNSLRSLQLFQLMRFASTLVVSVFVARLLPKEMVGFYEKLLLIGSASTFFWVSGVINPFIPFYKVRSKWQQKALIFNIFLLLVLLSFITALLLAFFIRFEEAAQQNLFYIFLVFNFFAAPAFLLEYLLLIKDKFRSIFIYGLLASVATMLAVSIPLFWDKSLFTSLVFLAFTGAARFVLLFYYVKIYGKTRLRLSLISGFVKKIYPYIISLIIGGSSLYIDGFVIEYFFNDADFAIFRYGARELPFVLLLANAFSNVKSGEIASADKNKNLGIALSSIRLGTAKLMHWLFPLTIAFLLLSKPLFFWAYGEEFIPSAQIFNIYLLLIISRLAFPQTILMGLQQNRQLLKVSAIEWALNIILDISFVMLWGMQGVAIATVLAYAAEKLLLFWYCRQKNIAIASYFPIKVWALYTTLTLLVFLAVSII